MYQLLKTGDLWCLLVEWELRHKCHSSDKYLQCLNIAIIDTSKGKHIRRIEIMNNIAKAVTGLNNAIALTMVSGGYLTLEIGVCFEGNTSVSVNVYSGISSRKIHHCAMKGVISNIDQVKIGSCKGKQASKDVFIEFEKLLLSIIDVLSDKELGRLREGNNMKSFNAKIKPWGMDITHLDGSELVRAAQIQDCKNMLVSDSNGCEYGSFEIGKAETQKQITYELLSNALSQTEHNYRSLNIPNLEAA